LANGTQTQFTLISNVSNTSANAFYTVNSITVTNPGSNYNYAPQIVIKNGMGDVTGAGAEAVATISNGAIANITVTNQGIGYTAQPTIEIRDANTRSLGTIIITNAGAGYSNNPTVIVGSPNDPTYSHPEQAYAVVGLAQNSLTNLLVTNTGKGYSTPPTVLVSAAQNNYPSVQANLVAILNTGTNGAATANILPYYTSDAVEGGSYYLRNNPFQTVAWNTSNTFVGNIYLQGSLSPNSAGADWFDIKRLNWTANANTMAANATGQETIVGKFKYIRARVEDFAGGTINTLTITYPYTG
jgi:hypothetical protein